MECQRCIKRSIFPHFASPSFSQQPLALSNVKLQHSFQLISLESQNTPNFRTINMQFSVISLAMLLSAGLAIAAPAPVPGPPGPPPPPPGKSVASISQSCSASQSSISCCNESGGPPPGPKGGKGPASPAQVAYNGQIFNLQCSQIIGEYTIAGVAISFLYTMDANSLLAEEAEAKNPVLNICSTTVACCIGTGCVAIAE